MTTKQFETWLVEAIDLATAEADDDAKPRIRRVATNEEAGVLTRDRGLVVAFEDGSEIQVTLVRSRLGRDGSYPDEDEHSEEEDEDDGTLAYAARVNGIR